MIDAKSKELGFLQNTRAYPILFIDNDIRDVDLTEYEPDKSDKIYFYRHEQEMQDRIDEYVEWGIVCKVVPIICAYNLMFDLQPLMEDLNSRYDIQANAQSSTNVYTVDLYEKDSDRMLLRFWDTFHLEMRGLAAMGKTCGISKAVGDWNYDLIRTPETELTELELFYASRDVQVIPAYLKYLLRSNEWMKQSDLGNRVLTKTSIVRQMARRQIGTKMVDKENGKKLTLDKAMISLCNAEQPKTYAQYAVRKACFRGGYTFTSAAMASRVVENVVSVDVTSMHHTFINGRRIPQHFKVMSPEIIQQFCERVLDTTRDYVMGNYDKPFEVAFHARIKFNNIRLRKGSAFEHWGIALLASSKFNTRATIGAEYGNSELNQIAETEVMQRGYRDEYKKGAIFAFGKLYEAEQIIVHVTELELWCMSRVYEWDSYEVIGGDGTASYRLPPDFVTAQSNVLYKQKQAAKFIDNHYKEGEPYPYNLSGIPDGIAKSLADGSCEHDFFRSWYTGTVKGMFNGIYGTMAQDQLKPSYKCVAGELVVDEATITTPENFDERLPKNSRVLYTYGMRIVGGSRMHMIIAIELVYEWFGSKVDVLGGDTDSMKMRCDYDITDDEIDKCLQPIADASKKAIDFTMMRLRKQFPQFASPLTGIGGFEVENRGHHYAWHLEGWNKCRISVDEKAHITCAGLSRPIGSFTIENLVEKLLTKYSPQEILPKVVGYNVFVKYEISHALMAHHPKVSDVFKAEITDYLGNRYLVNVHESTSLYVSGKWLGETIKISNLNTVIFLRDRYGLKVDTSEKWLFCENGKCGISLLDGKNLEVNIDG